MVLVVLMDLQMDTVGKEIYMFVMTTIHCYSLPISGRVDRVSATEAVDSSLIPTWVKPKTIKIGIHSFPAWCSAIKGTVWSLYHMW